MKDTKSTLLVPFLDETESFTLGFECGIIWSKLEKEEEITNQLIHLKNKEQIMLLCANFSLFANVERYCDEWGYLSVKK
jgi:hypothetical protein